MMSQMMGSLNEGDGNDKEDQSDDEEEGERDKDANEFLQSKPQSWSQCLSILWNADEEQMLMI